MADRRLMQYYYEELLKRIEDLKWHGGEGSYWKFEKETIECLNREYEKLSEHIKVRDE